LFNPSTPLEQYPKLSCDEDIAGTESQGHPETPPKPTAAATVEPESSPDARRVPPRLSEFQANCKRRWTLPEFNPDEHTFVLAASNGVSLAKSAPRGWQVAAYRGARFVDVQRVLATAALPEHINTVIVTVGLNDRFSNPNTIRDNIHQLKLRLQANSHRYRILILPLPNFALDPITNEVLPRQFSEGHGAINQAFYDLFQSTAGSSPSPWISTMSNASQIRETGHILTTRPPACSWPSLRITFKKTGRE